MSRTRRWSILYNTIVLLGFLAEVYLLSYAYLMYETSSSLQLELSDKIVDNNGENNKIPSLAICSRYTDIMNLTALGKKVGQHLERSNEEADIERIESLVSIADIFEFTPNVSAAMHACFYRSKDGMQLNLEYQPQCSTEFTIKKFYVFEHVCYTFKLDKKQEYPLSDLPKALTYPNFLLGIILTSKFKGMNLMILSIHYGEYPDISIAGGHRFHRLEDFKAMIPRYESIGVMYQRIGSSLLPAPYDTRCNHDFFSCTDSCWNLFQNQTLKKIRYDGIIRAPNSMRHITRTDLMDAEIRQLLSQRSDYCQEKCSTRCTYNYAITNPQFYTPANLSHKYSNMRFQVYIQNQELPAVRVVAYPSFDFMAYIIFIGSGIGTWLGVDLFSLEQKILKFIRNRKRIQRRGRKKNRIRHDRPHGRLPGTLYTVPGGI